MEKIEPLKKLLNIKDKEEIDYKFLLGFNNDRLFDIIRNFEEQGYKESIRFEAILILKSRGINSDTIRNNDIDAHADCIITWIHDHGVVYHKRFGGLTI